MELADRDVLIGTGLPKRAARALLIGLVLALAASAAVTARTSGTYTAEADFFADSAAGPCRETTAHLVATEGPADTATVDLTYSVVGSCGDADGLSYYELSSLGPVTISSRDLRINPALRRATLDTIIDVYDDEGGTTVAVRVQAAWKTGPAGMLATISLSAPYLNPLYLTNPLSTVDARLSAS
jgi:hypothetical protein